ncbi:hypothetical protein GCM10010140_37930 [Streptosporangium pseudovulgare]|uniref:Uncharacterized protein n=1 Tax=Streptosporangium pseudovulgare TaxID=35765 RepID=A0ABQ2QYL5_9ACTN|nr:hypothetical protein GCM10010140_37930 [Streptosporangium pseudovulgare]
MRIICDVSSCSRFRGAGEDAPVNDHQPAGPYAAEGDRRETGPGEATLGGGAGGTFRL